MKLQSRSRDEPEINVISLVDVLLVLVLFFMVSTTFMRESEIGLLSTSAFVLCAVSINSEGRWP